jgi:hypothetical protein
MRRRVLGSVSDIGCGAGGLDCWHLNDTRVRAMQTTLRKSFPVAGLIAGLLLSTGAAMAAATESNAEIQARYERERAVCLNGKSNQDQATCLKEAGAARDVARRGLLEEAGQPNYRRNQLDRCKALTGDEAKDCRLRMKGAGTVSGSASAGGIYRELTTVEPAAPAASAP